MARSYLLFAAALLGVADAALLRKVSNHSQSAASSGAFTSYYATVKSGRGIWKWNNALVAYDRHMSQFIGKDKVIGAEVGVQSGGSLVMWHKVLGRRSVIHGLDINPMCSQFVDKTTSITIGDQEKVAMWNSFFKHVSNSLDFLVDDGGHFPGQMLQTTYSVFPKLNAGGVLAIEDIHGEHYLKPFFEPMALYLGKNTNEVASVHLYPYLMVVQKVGSKVASYDPTTLPDANIPDSGRISTVEGIKVALAAAPPGSLIVLENKNWGHFINENGLMYFFREFIDLYQPTAMPDDPPGCAQTSVAVCTSGTTNSALQSKVYGVHILPTKLVVEVPSKAPVIEAVRHGDKWVRRPENNEIPERLKGALAGDQASHLLPK